MPVQPAQLLTDNPLGFEPFALAYHAHLAAIERNATEQLVAAKSHDWAAMHESVRRQAWAEAEDLIALAHDFKARWRDSDRLPGFDTIIRALDLAFKLKQFAAGMPSEFKEVNTTVSGAAGGPVRVELEMALKKIYGKPLPGEVVADGQQAPPDCVEAEVVSNQLGVSGDAGAKEAAGVAATTKC